MVGESESPFDDELFFELWDPESEDAHDYWDSDEDDLGDPGPPPWRRPLIIGVALLTVLAMALLPLYNLFQGSQRVVADNGLEVCGFDYCIVQEAVRSDGQDLAMSRFANTFLDESGAQNLADLLTDYLGIDQVSLLVVDQLDGRIEGQYEPATRTALVQRPVRAWTVIHEVAHAVSPGHGEDFQRALIEMTAWLDSIVVD